MRSKEPLSKLINKLNVLDLEKMFFYFMKRNSMTFFNALFQLVSYVS